MRFYLPATCGYATNEHVIVLQRPLSMQLGKISFSFTLFQFSGSLQSFKTASDFFFSFFPFLVFSFGRQKGIILNIVIYVFEQFWLSVIQVNGQAKKIVKRTFFKSFVLFKRCVQVLHLYMFSPLKLQYIQFNFSPKSESLQRPVTICSVFGLMLNPWFLQNSRTFMYLIQGVGRIQKPLLAFQLLKKRNLSVHTSLQLLSKGKSIRP